MAEPIDYIEGASILKTVKYISKWKQLIDKKRQSTCYSDDFDASESEADQPTEQEMIEFFQTFKKELFQRQQGDVVTNAIGEEEVLKEKEDVDMLQVEDLIRDKGSRHGRARANSTFQTVKYIGRWMRAVDKKSKEPGAEMDILDEEEDEADEEEVVRYFRSLELDDAPNTKNSLSTPEAVEGGGELAGEKRDVVLNTVRFIVRWMDRVEADKKKTRNNSF
eukprot:TCONS_00005245-protein